MNNEELLSKTISILRFPLAVGIVFIHNQMDSIQIQGEVLEFSNWPLVKYSVNTFSQVLPRIAVPLFFLFSGYLFFKSGVFNKEIFRAKLKNRKRTLLTPYLFWNFVGFLILLTQLHPLFIRFFPLYENAHVDISTFLSCFWKFSLISENAEAPIDGPLWYVRDLMILCAIAPIIYYSIKKLKWPLIILLGLVWFFSLGDYVGLPNMCNQDLFFFPLGAYFAVNRINFVELVRTSKITSCLAYIAPLLLLTDIIVYPKFNWVHQCWVLAGMVAALYFTSNLILKGKMKENSFLTEANFFVYVLHYLIINKFMKMLVMFLHPSSPASVLALYFGVPIIVILLCLGVFAIMKKYTPSFLQVITGGR
jgi:surface polysaccharide O-acyltransferase-like enzyme